MIKFVISCIADGMLPSMTILLTWPKMLSTVRDFNHYCLSFLVVVREPSLQTSC